MLTKTEVDRSLLKDKLYNYDQMKRERLQEFINRVKDELLTWKKSAVDQTVSTTTMTVKGIIAKAERHEALWLRSLELEKLAADPARLMNRGGRLLHETKERQRLQIELPRLRQEIEKYIATNSGRSDTFARWGRDLLSHLDSQQRKHAEEKERERLERESRRKATPTKSSNVKRALCGTPSGTASRISRLGTSSATLGSSRRGATPASKNTLVAHGGTPVRAGAAAIAAAKSTRQRSLKAQKKSVNSRQLFKGKGADEASTSTAGPVGGLPSMDSFATSNATS
ncbi:protein regulator of cytokinesis 1 [Dermacentor silvarum]|uniref:protein regulator of cytokinesis 1 n=1 Tax=Dermacentor silvarum TaxID=543639 RepID=UPI002101CAC0|nr:protein regulator of cytokinesis 1 [Dermacentor silvarum]